MSGPVETPETDPVPRRYTKVVKQPVRTSEAFSLIQNQMMDASCGFALVGQDKQESRGTQEEASGERQAAQAGRGYARFLPTLFLVNEDKSYS